MAEMFRQKSLERLSTPDRLDQLLKVVKRKSWIPLLVLALVVALGAAWSVVGRIPVTAEGFGVLVHPRRVVSFQSPGTGQLVELKVRVGDFVRKGDVIGLLNLPDLKQQLEQEEARLGHFRARDGRLSDFEREQAEKEKRFLSRQRTLTEKRVASLRRMAESMKKRNDAYLAQQRQNVATTRRFSKELEEALQERFESYRSLKSEGLSSDDAVVNARRNYIENKLRLAELEVTAQMLELREIEAEEAYLKQLDQIADLEIQLQDLELQEARIDRRILEASLDSTSRIQEIERTIDRLKGNLAARGRIVSDYDGRILEITVAQGSFVSAGQRLGAMDAEDASSTLMTLAYFDVTNGKKIRRGMKLRVSPTTVQRERYGSMIGRVHTVSGYPVTTEAAVNQIGNAEMARTLTAGGRLIEMFGQLEIDPGTYSEYRWTSTGGPDVRITAGTTAAVRVTIEERAPITFVLPFLRSWLGVG